MPQETRYPTKHRFPRFAPQDGTARVVPPWAVIGIFLILLFNFITSASAFLMPVTLAMLLFFVFAPIRRLMARFGIHAGVAAAIITLGMLVLVGGLGYFISGPVNQIMQDSPRITERLDDRFRSLRESVRPIEEAAARIGGVANGDAAGTGQPAPGPTTEGPLKNTPGLGGPPVRPTNVTAGAEITPTPLDIPPQVNVSVETESASTLETIAAQGPSVIGQIVFTLFLLFFLLASGDLLYLKIVQSFDRMGEKRAAYMALREIETALGSYLGAITLINAGLAVFVGVTMWLWDMPQPLLWGIAAFLLNFIPYLGAVTGVAASFLVALISFDDMATPIFVALSYLGLTALEGQLVTPYFVSRRLQLNTVVVFVTVALWAWLWSVLGMVVAVPILVVMKVLADHVPGLEKLGNMLAGEAPPELDEAADDATIMPEDAANPPEITATAAK